MGHPDEVAPPMILPRLVGPPLPWAALPGPLCLLDLECSGYLPRRDRVVGLAALRLAPGEAPRALASALDPGGGRQGGLPGFAQLVPELRRLLEGTVLVAHNAALDACFLGAELDRLGGRWGGPQLCTLELAHSLLPGRLSFALPALSRDLCGPGVAAYASATPAERVTALHHLLGALLATAPLPERLTDTVRSLVRRPDLPTAWPRIVGSVLPAPRLAAAGRQAG